MEKEREMELRQMLREGLLDPHEVLSALQRLGMTLRDAQLVIIWEIITFLWYKEIGKEK